MGTAELIGRIRAGVIGDDQVMLTPYSLRRITYGDLEEARRLLAGRREDVAREPATAVSEDFESLGWFELPSMCMEPAGLAGQ